MKEIRFRIAGIAIGCVAGFICLTLGYMAGHHKAKTIERISFQDGVSFGSFYINNFSKCPDVDESMRLWWKDRYSVHKPKGGSAE